MILSEDLPEDSGHDKLNGWKGSQVKLPEDTYKYLETDFQVGIASYPGIA